MSRGIVLLLVASAAVCGCDDIAGINEHLLAPGDASADGSMDGAGDAPFVGDSGVSLLDGGSG